MNTTMLYRRQTKNFKSFFSGRNVVVIIFAVFIFLFVIWKPFSVIRTMQSVSLSFHLVKQTIFNGTENIFSIFLDKAKLVEENRSLSNQNAVFTAYASTTIASLKQTIADLENTLGRKGILTKNEIGSALVIGKPPAIPYGTIAIDFGSNYGVQTGDLVLVGNYIIGKILEVSENRSIVKLYGSQGESASLFIGEGRIPANGQGAGFGAYKARLANINKEIIGQDVRLSEHPEYIFGNITNVEQSGSDQYENLIIQSPVNIYEIGMVDIVRNEKK